MASGLYLLMRFFLRVDGVIVRLHDTRIYHQVSLAPPMTCGSIIPSLQAGTDFLTRELTTKEARIANLKVLLYSPVT